MKDWHDTYAQWLSSAKVEDNTQVNDAFRAGFQSAAWEIQHLLRIEEAALHWEEAWVALELAQAQELSMRNLLLGRIREGRPGSNAWVVPMQGVRRE